LKWDETVKYFSHWLTYHTNEVTVYINTTMKWGRWITRIEYKSEKMRIICTKSEHGL